MANAEHLAILNQGVKVWNKRRRGITHPDLRGVDLRGADLRGADLHASNLNEAKLRGADLQGANLRHAWLNGAFLREANLSYADLHQARLIRAFLREVKFTRANLRGADLREANLRYADLREANLRYANLGKADMLATLLSDTIFLKTNLLDAVHLDTCQHNGPSQIDPESIATIGSVPIEFLRGFGFNDWMIESYKLLQPDLNSNQITNIVYEIDRLRSENPIQFFSCFISYSHTDQSFARTLYARLQDKGIRCWLDEHQVLPGDDIRDKIAEGINLWDKIVLCCSEFSLNSYWVNVEIDKALKKEENLWNLRGTKIPALIPLNLDGYLFKWESSRASVLTDRLAEDLVDWDKNPSKLDTALIRIEKALRADPGAREKPPKPLL